MAILRDITARLGLQLDKGSFVQAERSIGGLTQQLSTLSSIVIGSGAALAVGKIVTLASDANETLNVLNASFEESSQGVQDWAAAFSMSAGRSEFELREMAGTLGAVLNPLMERNSEVAADMATNLSALAVDLGSFFNAADSDVLVALRSGIVGEAEPLKRFGIVMLDATLEAFRLSQGITKSFKSMSIAEKTALRYNFILDQTINAQGDAARTADGWANASKAVASAFKDLGTQLGLSVLPFVEKIATSTRTVVRGFLEWTKGTKILQSAMFLLGIVGAKIAAGLIIAWAPVIFPMLKMVAIFALLALAVDDFLTFLAGGDSVIGRFIEQLFGPGSAAAAAEALNETIDGLVFVFEEQLMPAMFNMGVAAQEATQAASIAFGLMGEQMRGDMETAGSDIGKFSEKFTGDMDAMQIAMGKFGADVNTVFTTALEDIGKFADDVLFAINKVIAAFSKITSISERFGASVFEFVQDVTGTTAAPTLAAGAAGAAGGTLATTNNSVTVNVQGNATANDAGRIAEASSAAQSRQARRTRAATTQRAPE